MISPIFVIGAAILLISFSGLTQITPLFFGQSTTVPVKGIKPYSPLQLVGRDIYIREGCSNCHTQTTRPFRAKTEHHGDDSTAGKQKHNRSFLWGSKRTGPDLRRIGTSRYSNEWHYKHLNNPRDVVPNSVMPAYPWLAKTQLSGKYISKKMRILKTLGHSYTEKEIINAPEMLIGKTEANALVAYLQSLGNELKSRR